MSNELNNSIISYSIDHSNEGENSFLTVTVLETFLSIAVLLPFFSIFTLMFFKCYLFYPRISLAWQLTTVDTGHEFGKLNYDF